jgi:hypothetical protein
MGELTDHGTGTSRGCPNVMPPSRELTYQPGFQLTYQAG